MATHDRQEKFKELYDHTKRDTTETRWTYCEAWVEINIEWTLQPNWVVKAVVDQIE
jgi:hypothetical protein